MRGERARLLELSATFADDRNGLSTRLEVGNVRTFSIITLGRPFGLNPSYEKSGVFHARARGVVLGQEPSPNIQPEDGSIIRGKEGIEIVGSMFYKARAAPPEI